MIPTAFGGIKFSDIQVSGGFGGFNSPGPSVQAIDLTREDDTPIAVGTRVSSRVMPIQFTLTQYDSTGAGAYIANGLDVVSQRMRLLAALQPGNGAERVLVVKTKETGGAELQGLARVGQYRYPNGNTVEVDFILADDRWLERVVTSFPQVNLGAASDTPATPLPNGGGTTVKPVIRLGWSQAKSNHEYIRQVTISNTSTRNWRRMRFTVDLGDTAALVTAGKIPTSFKNLRVRVSGDPSTMELPRTITNGNTKRTLCHVVVPLIPAGQSLTLDFLYGNIVSDTPQDLDTRTGTDVDTYAADDLEGDTGTASAGAAATLTDGTKSWETNRWRYGYLQIVSGRGSGQRRKIAGNTGTVITVTRNWSTQPDNTSVYVIWMTGIAVDGGITTAIGTTTTLTDSSQAWGVNEWAGGSLYNITKGLGPFPIISNTATVITTGAMTAPANSDSYYLERFGVLQYMVNNGVFSTLHRGLWRTNRYTTAGKVWYGNETPGGWMPWPMLVNNNPDNFAQGRYLDVGSGGGHTSNYFPGLYARRGVRSDNTWPEKGQADGVAYYDPRGLVAIDFDYELKNEGTATVVGQAVLMSQADAGDRWQTINSDSAAHATLATVTAGSGMAGYNRLNTDDTPVRVYLGVLPLDGVAIPSTTKKDRSIELRNHAKMVVYLDVTYCGGMTGSLYSWGSEIEVYNLQATGRLGGGTDAVPPYDEITADVLLRSGQELWINGDPGAGKPLVGIYAASSGALVRSAPWAATIKHHELDADGNDDGGTQYRSLKLAPGNNLLPLAGIGGYTLTKTVGVTVVDGIISDPAYGWGGSRGRVALTISATPAGAWTIRLTYPAIAVIPDTLYEFGFVATRTGLSAGVQTAISVQWGDAGGNFNLADPNQLIQRYMLTAGGLYAGGGGRKIYAGPPNDGSGVYVPGETTQAIVQLQVIGTGSMTGGIDFLYADLGVTNLYIYESPTGILTTQGQWREGEWS